MLRFSSILFLGICLIFVGLTQVKCAEEVPTYANLQPGVKYVGKEACAQCHVGHFESFMHTGMGLSIDTASPEKSALYGQDHPAIYDEYSDLFYAPIWEKQEFFILEFRVREGDTIHQRKEKVDFIIGSGQHTNSHLFDENGYVHQMPLTFYTQDQTLDLPPGFEGGQNSRFNRIIGLECMSCHNAYPEKVFGSENKFKEIPRGIDCERCHGPGEIHVKEKLAGNIVDTSQFIDYSIVNPAKLPVNLQFEVCQRCHLQGNTVVQDGKSFLDFKPGMELSEVMEVYIPRYDDSDENFIMASHVDRLKSSECFKQTGGELVCFTCHNPHKSVKITDSNVFNSKCESCHNQAEPKCQKEDLGRDCVTCHMPNSSSSDIPHVSITDHKIAIPQAQVKTDSIREFLNLYCVNNPNPSSYSRAKAFLNQFEKFDPDPQFLDSAWRYIQGAKLESETEFHLKIRWYFLKGAFAEARSYIDGLNAQLVLDQWLNEVDHDNKDAWSAYRVGEMLNATGQDELASRYFEKAVNLAPFVLDFQIKYGVNALQLGRVNQAKDCFEFILEENKNHAEAWNNLGFVQLQLGDIQLAKRSIQNAIDLNPNYALAYLNLAQANILTDEKAEAIKCLEEVLILQPNHRPAQQALDDLLKTN